MKSPYRTASRMRAMAGAVLCALTAGVAFAQGPSEHARHLIYLPADRAEADSDAIAKAFADAGFQVTRLSARDADAMNYARRVAREVKDLLAQGIAPEDISVVGAGIGSRAAVLSSGMSSNRSVSYVLLGQCDTGLKRQYRFNMSGRVLGIRDEADASSHSCRELWRDAPQVTAQREIVTSTGLGAALFDRPREEWLRPALVWTTRGQVDVGAPKVSQAD